MQASSKLFKLLFWSTLIRMILSMSVGLGNDEVYYRMYAEYLELNYFDHPPMVGWLIRLFTFDLHFDTAFFIRLTATLSGTATAFLIYLIGKKWRDEQTGFLAAWLYSITIYGAIIAGTFILPDSPQVFFWAWGLYAIIQVLHAETSTSAQNRWMLLFGFANGLGLLCKVHMIFLWGGFGLYILIHDRQWLKRPSLYAAAIITILLFYPVIHWNIKHDFITYRFHSNRVNDTSRGFRIDTLIPFLLGQFLYTQILLFPFYMTALWKSIFNPSNSKDKIKIFLVYTALPLLLVSLYLSCFNTVLPHWTGPAYIAITLFSSAWYAENNKTEKLIRWTRISTYMTLILVAVAVIMIQFLPGTLGKKGSFDLGSGDFTLDMYGWNQGRNKIDALLQKDVQQKRMKENAVFLSHKWFPAAHEDFYVCIPLKRDLLVVGDTMDIHQYAWINPKRKSLQVYDDAYVLVPSNYFDDPVARWGNQFESHEPADTIPILRSGVEVRKMLLYRFHSYKSK
ncbi:MAG: hypothetical protein RL582_438 [Bacteroidota bacterium]|jgi:4-amino-4-deoxy-L-arabinose transferase-like glycosyltransferase